ncbi:MAG: redoxin domain-containing protein [Acidobacteria bacterium]|nr:redoxin domain-containing protein [Acidobacteriota bacterium]NIM61416.1 redoxin domain-containing protein [Acidobacteriota bacterium]NIO59627.1 redoxin domain-containing protein [Acidobacteriota bacterium]NIQ30724.1 redoxin domain-containing protein [Acidobacteriota bacterium]NIQ85720.1 redoxin domain-containing protein [Acidobacteriota bacterium]
MSLLASAWFFLFVVAASEGEVTDLAWTDLRGHEQTLESYRGRIVVLNFWATWCAPCRKEMPDLVRIQKRYGMYGVQVIGASADEPGQEAAVEAFARRRGINFPVWLGATTAWMEALDVGVALPATVVIDREGRVVERIAGVFDADELAGVLDRLVAGEPHEDAHDRGDEHDHGADEDEHPPTEDTASLVPS